jgi:hypothetical protein
MHRSRPWTFSRYVQSLAALALLGFSSCTIADSFGARAVEYNRQTAESKATSVLLNILRAAYTRPLQFTEVSTITGQATATFMIGSTLPVFLRGTGQQLYSFSPSITASGNDTFNIANISSQEFYQGIQSPLKTETIGYYLSSGLDPVLVLTLMLSDIVIDDGVQKIRLHNTAKDDSYYAFYSAMAQLVAHGLNVEPTQSTKSVGPILTDKQADNPQFLINATPDGGASLKKFVIGKDSDPELTESDKKKLKGMLVYYRIIKNSTGLRFCFDPLKLGTRPFPSVDLETVPSAGNARFLPFPLAIANGRPIITVTADALTADLCGSGKTSPKPLTESKAVPSGTAIRASKNETIFLIPRSVQEIFFFLGEMARRELGLSNNKQELLQVPAVGDAAAAQFLFLVQRQPSTRHYIAATLDQETFFAAVDPSRTDASGQVIQLLTDLLALNSSSKNLPAPSAIPLIAPP